jgi:hypothetical protein
MQIKCIALQWIRSGMSASKISHAHLTNNNVHPIVLNKNAQKEILK